MLAEAPLWLQEWSMSRNNAAAPRSRSDQNGAFLGLGPLPDYLRDWPRCDHVEEALKAIETTWSEQLERQIRSALKSIPADQYDIWIKVGMALKSLGWDRGDGTSIGFDLWDEWSATCREKYSLAVLEAKWPTFTVSVQEEGGGGCEESAVQEEGGTRERPANARLNGIGLVSKRGNSRQHKGIDDEEIRQEEIDREEDSKIGQTEAGVSIGF